MNASTTSASVKKPTLSQLRLERCINANEFLQVVASCGRNFFRNTGAGHDGYLTMNGRGTIVWFHDNYTGQRINVAKEGSWDGFSHGGTLKWLVGAIGKHVLTGSEMRYGYFQPVMDNGMENPWGYDDDILLVRDAGVRLGMITPATPVVALGKINTDLDARRNNEQKIIIAAAESLIEVGCSVSVVVGEVVLLSDSTDPIEIDKAFCESGESGFSVKRVIDGAVQEGWIEFVSAFGIEVTADDNLQVHHALQVVNELAAQLGLQRNVPICESCGYQDHPDKYGSRCPECGADPI